ncbi:hypothetical protein NQ314_003194 [Rhamnusium bicolor]|uniref:Uncharacterized protein n=1 Tax=Rhamnusium bicolor TaxID=1586634 RepID=A0AAV8ZPQ3_9CUCU|nr:hypothetical protein NQ314_003194 [Rhamnusium bicolor]
MEVSELLSRKSPEDIRIVTPTPVISTVKSNQNITNINITTQTPPANISSTNSDLQVFQKGSQITTLVSNNCLESKEPALLPVRSKSSLSNVSSTHIPAPSQGGEYNCHKNQYNRHKHRSSRSGLQPSLSSQTLDNSDKITYRKHNYHHHHREKDYSSETNSAVEQVTRYHKKKNENHRYSADFAKTNSDKEYTNDIMDQSFKKATKIVHELTRNRDPILYEKHRQKCLMASEKYNSDILKHYNSRKSTSVLDFRSEIHIGPKYSDSKSVGDLDAIETVRSTDRMYKKIQDSRSVKSLDFDSDCNSTSTSCRGNEQTKSVDYTSEPTSDSRKLSCYQGYYENNIKPRPTPPKKPLRLSLHKTHSLQSVETNSDSQCKGDRKSLKRNYKGEIPVINYKSFEQNGDVNGQQQLKWNYRKGLENNLENGSWC